MFENSPDETKTQTEKDFNLSFVKQIGDIGLIVRWILFAVFFTLLLVVGNTMAQSVRERMPELAVLKTLGFSDGSVLGFVFAEAFALCLFGGFIGLILATLAGAMVRRAAAGSSSSADRVGLARSGSATIILMSIAVGLLPALRARRLKIVDALAGAERFLRRSLLLSQMFAITGLNLRSIPQRWASVTRHRHRPGGRGRRVHRVAGDGNRLREHAQGHRAHRCGHRHARRLGCGTEFGP